MLLKANHQVIVKSRMIDHNHPRLSIIAHTKSELLDWLETKVNEKFAFDGKAHVYSGTYSKAFYGSSHQRNGGMIQSGLGKGTIGVPILSFVTKRLMEASHVIQDRYFVGVIHHRSLHGKTPERAHPEFMFHQDQLSYRQVLSPEGGADRGSFTLKDLALILRGPETGSGSGVVR